MRRTLALGVVALAFGAVVTACGMASKAAEPPDAGVPQIDGGMMADDADFGPVAPRLVVVNAITEVNGAFDGVVICLGKSGAPRPQTIMPLTNFAGIPVGGGADFGSSNGSITLNVFDAATVPGGESCGSLVNTQPHASLPVDVLGGGVTVLALVTDLSQPKHVKVRQIRYPSDSSPQPGFVKAHFANLSAATGSVKLSVAGVPKADLATDNEVSSGFSFEYGPQVELVATTLTGTVAQSLESVQYATDPTSTPEAFFGVRASFVFALVGDPKLGFDAGTPAKDLTGRELHLIAVPYGDGLN